MVADKEFYYSTTTEKLSEADVEAAWPCGSTCCTV